MHHSTLHSLFRYKAWADGELLDALATLDAAQYGEAHHTALRIFNHIHVVDAIFKGNLLGEPHGFSATNTPETPTLAALRSAIGKLDAWYLDYVASLSQADGEAVLSFNFVDGDKGQMNRAEMLLHLVTHGGYHRGAIGRLLVQCGITPPRDTLTAFLHRNEPERCGG
ncbi:DNA damage-inducible protein DinB [Aeromonas caviae]|uniref:DNA damage-inducible protein DinB n=1 Tax=Aeromonas caviae TaxID=648 RepID=A0ABD0B2N4_AERCA|nr:DinB family protein [Aeromonas caviae]BCR28161.1 DNA damage-inducible protein DinB [Aeromonas caviae]GJA80817.1 DNA damage-inducible protein DinB [Aeromonas caviae]GJB00290.1 DNA damage-inducible protein DinB [Aeromonas caviae]GJB12102.1 DNA damage-inducible protein DinB [Aeromonas caviae]GJB22825.1 DNA damage-inducible protein DinB [Aeromonas caviae]